VNLKKCGLDDGDQGRRSLEVLKLGGSEQTFKGIVIRSEGTRTMPLRRDVARTQGVYAKGTVDALWGEKRSVSNLGACRNTSSVENLKTVIRKMLGIVRRYPS